MCKRDISPFRSKDYLTLLREHQTVVGKLQTVMNNHKALTIWSTDMNGALSDLAQQVVNMGGPITEEDEWHIPEQEKQP
jgi:hypothetical protein